MLILSFSFFIFPIYPLLTIFFFIFRCCVSFWVWFLISDFWFLISDFWVLSYYSSVCCVALYCMLCCTVVFFAVLCFAVLLYAALCRVALNCSTTLCCAHCTVVYCTVLLRTIEIVAYWAEMWFVRVWDKSTYRFVFVDW